MAEYGSMFAVSGLASLLFLGGWHTGFLPFEPTAQQCGLLARQPAERRGVHGQVLAARVRDDVGALVAAAAAHRPGDDDVPEYFLPISCVLLVGVCLWLLLVPAGVARW